MGRDGDDGDEDGGFQFLADAADDDATSDADDAGAFQFSESVDGGAASSDDADPAHAVDLDADERQGERETAVSPDTHTATGTHGAHHPVVEDWPRGVGEASWWPVITAVGAAAIYVSVALYLLGRGRSSVVSPAAGPTAFVGAVGVALVGVYGWLYHGFVAHFWTRGTDRRTARSLRWGMLGFIASEIATFGALFAFYFYIRAGPWPPANSLLGQVDLLNVLVVTNTAVLVLSSVTLHFAHHALADGARDRFGRLLGITIGLGALFLAGQIVEYHEFINQEGFDWTSGLVGSAFFGLTGLHGLHVAFGTLLLGITYVRGRHGQFDAERDLSVSLVSLYWHFVDVVWLFLVAALYAGASIY